MDPDRWRQIESLYHAALAYDESARDDFLRQACASDPSVQQEVQSLLSGTTGVFLESPDAKARSRVITSALRPGIKISHYKLLEKLGEGGMGVVFKARDQRLKRLVALKFIKLDRFADPSHERRLLREARTACAFRHPNIAHVYDVDRASLSVAGARVTFIAMEYVPGKTLSHVIAESTFDLHEMLGLALQAADALAAAHRAGVVHRDLKPGNIMVDETGTPRILDFGLAKFVELVPEADGPTLSGQSGTRQPLIGGTPAYMSPEQVEGKEIDSRSDIFSFGAVLYEMFSGCPAFQGNSNLSILSAVLNATPAPLQALRQKVPNDLVDIVNRCLEKNPKARYSSGQEMRQALLECQTRMRARETGIQAFLRRPRHIVPAALLVILLAATAAFTIVRRGRIDWARTQALPEISRLAGQENYSAAFALASRAERYIPNDPVLAKLWDDLSWRITVETSPKGANVYRRDYKSNEQAWEYLGKSPLKNIRISAGPPGRWKFDKEGYEPVERTDASVLEKDNSAVLSVKLSTKGTAPGAMVRVAPGELPRTLFFPGYQNLPAVRLDNFWIDKYEVTNRQYREFVRRGGYEKREYWKSNFTDDGHTLDWEKAMSRFRDATGEPGPAGWVQGEYPAGQDDFPVTGVSWYEAAAYAEFAGKALPTIYHWALAAATNTSDSIVPASNFHGNGPARVGTYQGMSPYGSYDMAGNVKEWCWNEAVFQKRYILGGAWNEPTYHFAETDARSPFQRDSDFGFRCVKYLSPVPQALLDPVKRAARDYGREKPASDQVFRAYRSLYVYDKTPLRPIVESVSDKDEYWKRERVTFMAAYGSERVVADLFLPKKSQPPFQTILYFPGVWAIDIHSSKDLPVNFDFILKGGRAVMCPVYKGTYERRDDLKSGWPNSTSLYRDHVIAWSKDLARSIDYLETRPDIDHNKLGYFGISWGAMLGALLPAVETRLQVCVLALGGFANLKTLPEVDQINFALRVKQPVLMLNGRYDFFYTVESSQIPMFRLLGTPAQDKRHLLYNTAHDVPGNALIQETLAWYDHYLGRVKINY